MIREPANRAYAQCNNENKKTAATSAFKDNCCRRDAVTYAPRMRHKKCNRRIDTIYIYICEIGGESSHIRKNKGGDLTILQLILAAVGWRCGSRRETSQDSVRARLMLMQLTVVYANFNIELNIELLPEWEIDIYNPRRG